jgi:hypothetical protein
MGEPAVAPWQETVVEAQFRVDLVLLETLGSVHGSSRYE